MIVDSGDDSVLVFPRTATGNVAPIRKLGGPKTQIRNIYGMTVDSVHNLIVVANRVDLGGRESYGRHPDLQPDRQRRRRAARGDRRAEDRHHQDPPGRRRRGARPDFRHDQEQLRELRRRGRRPSPWNPDKTGFIGVWSINDSGDVPPRGVIKGPASGLIWPAGVAINPKNHEVYTIDSVSNALFMFHMPELFRKPVAGKRRRAIRSPLKAAAIETSATSEDDGDTACRAQLGSGGRPSPRPRRGDGGPRRRRNSPATISCCRRARSTGRRSAPRRARCRKRDITYDGTRLQARRHRPRRHGRRLRRQGRRLQGLLHQRPGPRLPADVGAARRCCSAWRSTSAPRARR